MIKTILGLDISSSCVGFGVVEWNTETNQISFKDIGYYNPPKKASDTAEDFIEALYQTIKAIQTLINTYSPDYIGIENIVQFMKGKSGANTIITLAAFNRSIGLLCREYLGHSPKFFNVLSIRHGLKFNKALPDKKEMPELVAKHLGITFPWTLNKRQNHIVENYDAADGMAVALFHAQNLAGILPKKKPKKPKKPKKVKKIKTNEVK